MRVANRIVAEVLQELRQALSPGMSTEDLDRLAADGIARRGGKPAFLGYRGYPAALCVSVNAEVVHGIPSSRRFLLSGDLVSIDLGVVYESYYGDAAISVSVGEPSPEVANLLSVTEGALYEGIRYVCPGGRVQDISSAIQCFVEEKGYHVVRQFVGHGIGRSLHEPPEVPNVGRPGQGALIREGMVLAIEPMVNVGGSEVRVLADGWTAVTADGSLSAHFEHSVAVCEHGIEVLSKL